MTKFLSGKGSAQVSSGTHDFRRLTTHTRWMIRDWVRLNAKQVIDIAEKCGADLIVFESMRGFGAPGYEQARELDKKRRLGFFAFGSVRRKVVEKAVERGMRVVTVPYLCSSQHCSTCGGRVADLKVWRNDKLGKNQKKKKIFKCQSDKCGVELDSDANAARVIARVFWDEIRLPTTAE